MKTLFLKIRWVTVAQVIFLLMVSSVGRSSIVLTNEFNNAFAAGLQKAMRVYLAHYKSPDNLRTAFKYLLERRAPVEKHYVDSVFESYQASQESLIARKAILYISEFELVGHERLKDAIKRRVDLIAQRSSDLETLSLKDGFVLIPDGVETIERKLFDYYMNERGQEFLQLVEEFTLSLLASELSQQEVTLNNDELNRLTPYQNLQKKLSLESAELDQMSGIEFKTVEMAAEEHTEQEMKTKFERTFRLLKLNYRFEEIIYPKEEQLYILIKYEKIKNRFGDEILRLVVAKGTFKVTPRGKIFISHEDNSIYRVDSHSHRDSKVAIFKR